MSCSRLTPRRTATAVVLLVIVVWCLLMLPDSRVQSVRDFTATITTAQATKQTETTTTEPTTEIATAKIPMANDPTPKDPVPSPHQSEAVQIPQNLSYVFYATDNKYACSVLVNAHRLRNKLHSQVPIILIAGPYVSSEAIAAIKASDINITIVNDKAPDLGEHSASYYSQVLLKLRAFRLHQVIPTLNRIIILDSDQLVMKNLDHLFQLPGVDIAAPSMYWSGGSSLSVTTALMVGTLSDKLWTIIDYALNHMRDDEYDMDLINKVMLRRLMVLPGRYTTLNSHWEAQDTPGWFKGTKTSPHATDEEMEELYKMVEVLHFTAIDKPWNIDPDRLQQSRERSGKSRVHPLLVEQFREWHRDAKEVCSSFWSWEAEEAALREEMSIENAMLAMTASMDKKVPLSPATPETSQNPQTQQTTQTPQSTPPTAPSPPTNGAVHTPDQSS
ncbi:Similar to Glucose N-acetyltransferase 1; acc. no. Q4HVS2 [Pyronema omphalodes CBS 100304]|uniref:Similar to Glucose N-acetyltransferase 1 acc. no. Q4HVS2 n=1 Tax=Pyronema omphalodes (strain CBS 100304) TaxID=1076935 RepID=U4LWD0_PYROM|nr:Similar to Glucose N-acetyltransferase 1; acc. no. Q4HVS2 [Pyronema omphalodes CBS 100304]